MAKTILGYQDKKLSKWKNIRFTYQDYEYRANYERGFAPLLRLDRRKVGKRNFQYFNCMDVTHKFEITLDEVCEHIQKTLDYTN